MRAHTLFSKTITRAWAVAAALLPAAVADGHPDALGTRFVASTGTDAGDCDDNHHPCRTLVYALTQVEPGNAIKLATGSYDVSGIDVENLLIGKEGVRGGYSAEDHFAIQNAETHPTRMSGVPDEFRNNFIAHGFTVLDANGSSCRNSQAPPLVPTAWRALFPVTTSTTSRRYSCRRFPPRRPAAARSGVWSISTTGVSTPSWVIAMARLSMT
jgi:hypothetical protein